MSKAKISQSDVQGEASAARDGLGALWPQNMTFGARIHLMFEYE